MHFKKQSLPTKIKTLTIPSDCEDVKQELLLISSKKKKSIATLQDGLAVLTKVTQF